MIKKCMKTSKDQRSMETSEKLSLSVIHYLLSEQQGLNTKPFAIHILLHPY